MYFCYYKFLEPKIILIMKKLSISILALLTISLFSCNKVKDILDDPPTATPTAPTAPTPSIADAHGVLVSVKMTFAYKNSMVPIPLEMNYDIASAVFPSSAGSSSFADVGEVSVNSHQLDKADNNSYYLMAGDGLNQSNLGFSGNSKWEVNSLSINYSHSSPFPNFSGDLPESVNRSEDLVVDLSGNISGNPDSVIVTVITPNKQLLKTVSGSTGKVTFTSSELSSLSEVTNNTAYIEVAPYSFIKETISGKNYYFIKEFVATQSINVK